MKKLYILIFLYGCVANAYFFTNDVIEALPEGSLIKEFANIGKERLLTASESEQLVRLKRILFCVYHAKKLEKSKMLMHIEEIRKSGQNGPDYDSLIKQYCETCFGSNLNEEKMIKDLLLEIQRSLEGVEPQRVVEEMRAVIRAIDLIKLERTENNKK